MDDYMSKPINFDQLIEKIRFWSTARRAITLPATSAL
jgi:DNA-binding response OmpR family regulator